jgi:hypothetical protein
MVWEFLKNAATGAQNRAAAPLETMEGKRKQPQE